MPRSDPGWNRGRCQDAPASAGVRRRGIEFQGAVLPENLGVVEAGGVSYSSNDFDPRSEGALPLSPRSAELRI